VNKINNVPKIAGNPENEQSPKNRGLPSPFSADGSKWRAKFCYFLWKSLRIFALVL
jgi:hypothetical protein